MAKGQASSHNKHQAPQRTNHRAQDAAVAAPQQLTIVTGAETQRPSMVAAANKRKQTSPAAGPGQASKRHKGGSVNTPAEAAHTASSAGPRTSVVGHADKDTAPGAPTSSLAPSKQTRITTVAQASAGAAVTTLPKKGVAVSCNWQTLKAVLAASKEDSKPAFWRKRKADTQAAVADAAAQAAKKVPGSLGANQGITQVLALDCEMVGVGPGGERSELARVCVINNDGNVLLDTFVKPKERVTDFRTRFSGVRPSDLANALPFEEAQARVAELLQGRTLVGHALKNDLKVLLLSHPHKDIRDTARYPALMKPPRPGRKPKPKALRVLAQEELGLTIQKGEHDPADDARCALYLYHKHRAAWEASIGAAAATRKANSLGQKPAGRRTVAGQKPGEAAAALPSVPGVYGAGGGKPVSKGEKRKRRLGGGVAVGSNQDKLGHKWQYPVDVRKDPFADL